MSRLQTIHPYVCQEPKFNMYVKNSLTIFYSLNIANLTIFIDNSNKISK
jgi:hypothetical protein